MASTEMIPLKTVEDVLLHGGELEVVSSEAVQEDMVRRILAAEDIDDAFGGFQSTPCTELQDQDVEVRGIAWMRSAFKDGPAVYALLDAVVIDTGEAVTVNMGGRSLMASFVWAQRHKAMPLRGRFTKQQSNSNPERAFWLFKLA